MVRRSVGLPWPDLCPLAAVRHGGPAHLPHLLLLRLRSQVCLRNGQLLLRYEAKLILIGEGNKAWSNEADRCAQCLCEGEAADFFKL